jgi:hypothetical protein
MPTPRRLFIALSRILEVGRLREAKGNRAKAEARLEKAMQKAFKRQGNLFAEGFDALKPVKEAEGDGLIIVPEEWRELFDAIAGETVSDFVDPIQSEAEDGVLKAGQALIQSIGVKVVWNLQNERAIAYLDEYAAKRVAELNQVTKERIATIIRQGNKAGWSYDKVARAIIAEFEAYAAPRSQKHIQTRAHLIAVTEVGEAYTNGAYGAAEEIEATGIEMEKSWLTSGDDRVSSGCLINGSEEWIPLKQAHKSGDLHPLRFPGCRCDELYRRKGDENE